MTFALLVFWLMWFGLLPHLPMGILYDFGTFVASGRAALRGDNPYGVHELTYRTPDGPAVNLNPPFSVLIFQLLAPLDPFIAYRIWYVLALVLYLTVLVLICRAYPQHVTVLRVTWALALAGLWQTLMLGQLYIALLAVAVAAWLLLARGHKVMPGICLGFMVALKPHFMLWPVLLLSAGYRIAAIAALLVAALLSILPVLVYGSGIYAQWFAVIPLWSEVGVVHNASLAGMFSRLGLPWLGQIASLLLIGTLALWTWCTRPSTSQVNSAALTGSLLCSPITWTGYTLLLLPIFFSSRWSALLMIAAVILLIPDEFLWSIAPLSQWHLALAGLLRPVSLLLVLATQIRCPAIKASG